MLPITTNLNLIEKLCKIYKSLFDHELNDIQGLMLTEHCISKMLIEQRSNVL
jgi:hypothetical protein